MNVKPKNYSWPEFYRHVIDLGKYSFSAKSIVRRFAANRMMIPKWMNVVRAISSEGFGRIKYNTNVHKLLTNDVQFRRYFERETEILPDFFESQVKNDLGSLIDWLPPGALLHDPNAYLKASSVPVPEKDYFDKQFVLK